MGTVHKLLAAGAEMTRLDNWVNVALGFGTARDKTQGAYFNFGGFLSDQELTSLYQDSDLAAKVVNIYPREAMREGYCLTGLDQDIIRKAENYLKPLYLESTITGAAIWARLYGGGALWPVTDEKIDPSEPLTDGPKKILTIRFYDRRFLQPIRYYKSGPKAGKPEVYVLTDLRSFGGGRVVGTVHETRLIFFPGALTEQATKLSLGDWDLSVLQVAYAALRSDGNIWKAIELLISDANQGVYSIKGLWAMMTGKAQEKLRERVKIMDLTKSVSRALLLDKDDETYERKPTNFAGLHELSDKSIQRVASASDIPYSILVQAPEGLNANGDGDLRWFYGRVGSYQCQDLEPPILKLVKLILSADGSPVQGQDLSTLGLRWKPLWTPTSKEKAEIEKLEAESDSIRIKDEVVTPEEVAVSRMGGETPGAIRINVEARQRILDIDEKVSKEASTQEGEGESKDQEQALNGTQIANMLAIVVAVAGKTIPVESGKAMLMAAFPLTEEQANGIIDKAGTSFEPPAPKPLALPPGEKGPQDGDPPTPPKAEPTVPNSGA